MASRRLPRPTPMRRLRPMRHLRPMRGLIAALSLLAVAGCDAEDVVVVESVRHAGWVSDTDIRMMLAYQPLMVVVRGDLPGLSRIATEAAVIDGIAKAVSRSRDSLEILADAGTRPHILVRFDPPVANTDEVCTADLRGGDGDPGGENDGDADDAVTPVISWRISLCNSRSMVATVTARGPFDLQATSPLEDIAAQSLVLLRDPRENIQRRGS